MHEEPVIDQPSAVRLIKTIADAIEAALPEILARRSDVTWKADGSPVTAADFFVQSLVEDLLSRLAPGTQLISEEAALPNALASDALIVLLDPIDGTENFCSGMTEWGVSVGIWRAGHHLASMIDLPQRRERLMTGEHIAPFRSRIIGLASTLANGSLELMGQAPQFRVTGCSVFNLYNVICGRFATFANPAGAHTWDILPGAMLALEHGCRVMINDAVFAGTWLAPEQKHKIFVSAPNAG